MGLLQVGLQQLQMGQVIWQHINKGTQMALDGAATHILSCTHLFNGLWELAGLFFKLTSFNNS